MPARRASQRVLDVAQEKFGFKTLRPGQQEAIDSVLARRDTLVVMPTGGGKSAIYQIPAVMLPGPTVVVSPLIALQRDQMGSIRHQEVAEAAVVNSLARAGELREAFGKLGEGELEFLFLAPEQFDNPETLERVKSAKPSLFVVDEAHCISEWGHDFRPDYLRLGAVIEELGHPVVLALTATAAPEVRDEIVARLHMRNARVVVRGFNRPNIWLGVRPYPTGAAKREALLDAVERSPKPGIVYASTRRHVEALAQELSERGVSAVFYHGGMNAKERTRIQEDFMSGASEVIVATSAFGMGIDKPDVRFVYHYEIPDSLDSYYQEVGRAGRDGKRADAILFYRPEDLAIHKFFKGGGKLDAAQMERVAEAVAHAPEPVEPEDLREETGLSRSKLEQAVSRLEEAGALEREPTGEVAPAEHKVNLPEVAEEAAEAQEERREWNALRIDKMRLYAELRGCRRAYLMNYFGEEFEGPCGFCDSCEAGLSEAGLSGAGLSGKEAKGPRAPFPLKSRVEHKAWGKGVVEAYEPGKVVVLFDDAGRKTLALEIVLRNGLLGRAA